MQSGQGMVVVSPIHQSRNSKINLEESGTIIHTQLLSASLWQSGERPLSQKHNSEECGNHSPNQAMVKSLSKIKKLTSPIKMQGISITQTSA